MIRRTVLFVFVAAIGVLAWPRAQAADCTSVKQTAATYARSVVIPDPDTPRAAFVSDILAANRGLFDAPELYRLVDWIADHPTCYVDEEITRAHLIRDRL